MKETVLGKSHRYLAEGRLSIRNVDEALGTVSADVRGGGAVYTVSYSRRSGWTCSCPARGRCCHREALALVVAVERPEARP